MSNLVTIRKFDLPYEAGIPKTRLESENIRCFLQDEYISQVYPFSSSATGGVKLQVMEEDAEKAIAILKEGGYIKDNDFEPSGFDVKLYKYFSKIPFLNKIYK
jgi:hypothetical protein